MNNVKTKQTKGGKYITKSTGKNFIRRNPVKQASSNDQKIICLNENQNSDQGVQYLEDNYVLSIFPSKINGV